MTSTLIPNPPPLRYIDNIPPNACGGDGLAGKKKEEQEEKVEEEEEEEGEVCGRCMNTGERKSG